ncbi:MAG: type I secretion system permease/ATPase [Microgenomates group bacterium]
MNNLPTTASYTEAVTRMRSGIAVAAVFSAVISVLMLTGSIYMLQVYDRVLTSGSIPTLLVLFGIVVVLYIFLAFYDGLRMRILSRLAMGLDTALSAQAFRQGLNDDHTKGGAGQARRDLETVRGFIASPAMMALFDLPFTALFLAILFVIHPILGWMTVGGMVMAGLVALANRAVLKRTSAGSQNADAEQRRLADGAYRAASLLAAMGMVGPITARWKALHDHALANQQQSAEPSEVLAALSRSLRMLLQSALLTAGAWLVIAGEISAGSIIASSILSGRALAPADQIIGQWRVISAAKAAHDRLVRTLSGSAPQSDAGSVLGASARVALPPPTGAIELNNVTRLAPAVPARVEARKILDAITFSLKPGDGLGVVGASASGKSTLARLLVGALSPDAGELRFDGATLDQWDGDELGRHLGYLPQRVDLLPGTVRDNIARFDPEATDEQVLFAAQEAGVHDMILRLPDGYATDLGRADVPLSGGQVQRIGLARALYGNPRILVLDEPNAHLDMAGEAALTRALIARRAAGVTVIVMAHRAGALAAISRLMVMQDGKIIQDGPRDDILTLIGTPVQQASPPAAKSSPERLASAERLRKPPGFETNVSTPLDNANEAFGQAADQTAPRVLFKAGARHRSLRSIISNQEAL